MRTPNEIRFLWWNVCDFAHFDSGRSKFKRWPKSEQEYEEKSKRIDAAFDVINGSEYPDLIGLGEITPAAAKDFRNRMWPSYELVVSNPERELAFQIAVLFRPGLGFVKALPILGFQVPEESRAMCVVDFHTSEFKLRFVFLHWPAFPSGGENRQRMADALRTAVFDYMQAPRKAFLPRNLIALGDFNM